MMEKNKISAKCQNFLNALKHFRDSAQKLSKAWGENDSPDTIDYPFPDCFEETVSRIGDWYNSEKAQAEYGD